jgi:transcriptional regulator of acetoin/glycerol metabolism
MSRSGEAEATATASETRSHEQAKAEPHAPHLFLALHCDSPLLGGARYRLSDLDEVVFARAPARSSSREVVADGRRLTVRIPGTFVSRTHARLVRAHEAWILVDAESRNGTFVNGGRIAKATLSDGDIFECGRTLFAFRASLPAGLGLLPDRDDVVPGDPLATLLPSLEVAHIRLAAVARATLPILLLGESGSGKEVAARAIHDVSGRAGANVSMNCAAIPLGLLESQLFGHVKGAFSGAVRDEPGHFRAADHGTLFLDEIGDLPLAAQAAFLRALEEGAVVPVGATRAIRIDARVVAATNRPLQELVAQGAFREDLLARLSGFTHRLLPLRERMCDLGLLIAALLPRLPGVDASRVAFTPEAGLRLLRHPWPLNVRELRHCLASALVIADGAPIGAPHVEPALANAIAGSESKRGVAASPTAAAAAAAGEGDDLRGRVAASLEANRGNVAAVARELGKAPTQIHRWMKQLGLDPNAFRREK